MRSSFSVLLVITCLMFFGSCNAQEIERQHLNSWEQDTGYTQTIKVGDFLYLSGLTSAAPTMAEQINEIYSTIQSILTSNGITTESIIKETIYTLDIESLKNNSSERKKYFSNNLFPASTWVQVDRLFNPGLLLEVEVVAKLPAN